VREVDQVLWHPMMLHSHDHSVSEDEKRNCQLEVPVVDHIEEYLLAAFGLIYFDLELFTLSNLLNFDPRLLLLRNEHTSKLFFLFDFVKVIYYNPYEQIDYKLAPNDHE